MTSRTVQARFLLTPSPELNKIILGVLGRAQRLVGAWFDRTQEYWARQRREPIAPRQFATEETVTLEPLPCWSHLSADAVRQRVADLVEGIEAKAAAKLEETCRPTLGAAAVCAQLWHHRSARPKKSPAPAFSRLHPPGPARVVPTLPELRAGLPRGGREAPRW